MARIRTIKPEFWSDDKITVCSLSARLLFIASWNFADDEGNLERSAKQLKARAFPHDNIECEPLIAELLMRSLFIEYAFESAKYLHIQGFKKHQLINRPSKPSCPKFNESLIIHVPLTEYSQQEGKGREGIKTKTTTLSGKPDDKAPLDNPKINGKRAEAIEILDFLNTKTGHHYQPVAANLEMIAARLKEGFTVAQMRQVIALKTREWGTDEKMEKYLRPATLFNRTKFANYQGELGNGDSNGMS